jgi:hypothetical protein
MDLLDAAGVASHAPRSGHCSNDGTRVSPTTTPLPPFRLPLRDTPEILMLPHHSVRGTATAARLFKAAMNLSGISSNKA